MTKIISDNVNGEPININFGLTLRTPPGCLPFTTDAFLLSAYISRPAGTFVRAAELGAGSGAVSLLTVCRGTADTVTAFEVQPELYEALCQNIEENGYSDRITPVAADIRELTPSIYAGQFDLVFSNPPYLRPGTGLSSSSRVSDICRREVLGGIREFTACAAMLLRYGGMFYAVYRPERIVTLLRALSDVGLELKIMTYVYPDANSTPSLVLVGARRGGGEGARITAPLFIYKDVLSEDGCREETDVFREIYEKGCFPDGYVLR